MAHTYTLLLADDETLIRQSLKVSIDFNTLPLKLIGEAKNGEQALQIVREQVPDILITDVKMPGMDGLALIEQIKKHGYPIQIIVISGYDDYEYIRTALTHGSIDYICKPIDPSELNAALKTAVHTIQKEQRSKHHLQNIEETLKRNKPYLQEQFLYNLAAGHASSEEEQEQAAAFFRLQEQLAEYVCCAFDTSSALGLPVEAYNRLIISLRELFANHFGEEHVLFYTGPSNELFGIVSRENLEEVEAFEQLAHQAEEFVKFFSGMFADSPLRISISNVHKGAQQLQQAHNEADKTLKDRFYSTKAAVLCFTDEFSQHTETQLSLLDLEKEMLLAISSSDEEMAARLADAYYQILFLSDRFQRHTQRLAIHRLLLHFEEFLYESKLSSKQVDDMLQDVEQKIQLDIMPFIHVEDIKGLIEEMIALVNRSRNSKYTAIIETVLEYLQDHFKQDISLADAANCVDLTPNYLSALFNKYHSDSFSKTLTNMRLEYAKEMLATHAKIQDIALGSGFSNPKYFNRIFKRHVGCTPTEYRTQLGS